MGNGKQLQDAFVLNPVKLNSGLIMREWNYMVEEAGIEI